MFWLEEKQRKRIYTEIINYFKHLEENLDGEEKEERERERKEIIPNGTNDI